MQIFYNQRRMTLKKGRKKTEKPSFDIITIGGATEDMSLYTSEGVIIDNKDDILRQKLLAFEYGAKIKIDKAISTFGGGAANAAVAFARLGFKVAAFIAVGDDDRGTRIISNLRAQQVETKFIEIIKHEDSGFSPAIIGKDNEHIFFSIRGSNSKLTVGKTECKDLEQAKWLYLTSLSGDWQPTLKAIFSVRSGRIAWNPGHIQLNHGKEALGPYLRRTEVLIVNIDEARELVMSDAKYRHKNAAFFDRVKDLLEIIYGWGPKIVVITQGKNGSSAFDGREVSYVPIREEKRHVNTIGVGDAFGSSFVAGLEIFDGDIKQAMGLGVRNTSSVVANFGAQTGLIYRSQINKS